MRTLLAGTFPYRFEPGGARTTPARVQRTDASRELSAKGPLALTSIAASGAPYCPCTNSKDTDRAQEFTPKRTGDLSTRIDRNWHSVEVGDGCQNRRSKRCSKISTTRN